MDVAVRVLPNSSFSLSLWNPDSLDSALQGVSLDFYHSVHSRKGYGVTRVNKII